MPSPVDSTRERLASLKSHLARENPVLVEAIDGFQALDRVGWRTGLLARDESTATRIAWWPLVSVLGTFSAGKSAFINRWLGVRLQKSGNQAVDDRFTVICYGSEEKPQVLPGLALDADMRFPFYRTSEAIARLADGDALPVDAYLQLKTVKVERLRGRILVDSPGFDADAQRSATLLLTEHIMDMSDLVLVFFDARHPEPGAMKDTLEHLVGKTIERNDANKFLFILNQIDTAAADDNAEEVISAWQRALAQAGLGASRTLTLFNPDVAVAIADVAVRERYEQRNAESLRVLEERIDGIDRERAYRVVGELQTQAQRLVRDTVPRLQSLRERWRARTLQIEALILAALCIGALALAVMIGGSAALLSFLASAVLAPVQMLWFWLPLLLAVLLIHFGVRQAVANRMMRKLVDGTGDAHVEATALRAAFRRNTRPWRSLWRRTPVGWNRRARRQVAEVESMADRFTRKLNDHFTDPSGQATVAPLDQASPVSPSPSAG